MMRESLKNKCDLFADNYLVLKDNFKWGYSINNKMGALLYTMENRTPDIEAIKDCRRIIKENTGFFSLFKDETTFFMTAVMLSLKPEPAQVLKNAVDIYQELKGEGFHSSPYLVLAAISIAFQADPSDYQRIIRTTKDFYDAMKEQHPFITSSDDYGFAALLTLAGKTVDQAVRDMEDCYRLLRQDFSGYNAVQALAEVLTFNEEYPTVKCQRAVDLYQALRQRNCKLSVSMQLSFLGILAFLKMDTNQLADEIAEVNKYIRQKSGFGFWSSSVQERVMFAAALVGDDYLHDAKRNTMEMTLASNIAGIILAQQMAAVCAASAASASAAAASAQ